MLDRNKLQTALQDFMPPFEKVQIDDDRRGFIAMIVTRNFEGMSEYRRQEKIWEHLRNRIGDEGIVDVQFVFTMTPEEYAAASKARSA